MQTGWRHPMPRNIDHLTVADIIRKPWQGTKRSRKVTSTAKVQIAEGRIETLTLQDYHHTRLLQPLTDARRRPHRHARVQYVRQIRGAISRCRTIKGQAKKGCEGTDGKLLHGGTQGSLRLHMIIEDVKEIIRKDRKGRHKQQTMNFEGLLPERSHDIKFRTRRSGMAKHIYIMPTQHKWTLMCT